MRILRWFAALAILAGYGFHTWSNRLQVEESARNLALRQFENSNAPVQGLAHLQQAQTLGWLIVFVIVVALVLPEIIRAFKAMSAEVSAN